MRRLARTLLGGVLALATLAACSGESESDDRYHDGMLFLATGNTTGVYYQLGGGYADLVSKYLPGYQLRSEPTGASGENVTRVDSGDMDLALSHADTAADGALGQGVFPGKPQSIVALARLYDNIAQVVVPAGAKVRTLADLRGKRVSTGTLNSGTDVVAGRMLAAAGLDPDRDIVRLRWSLPETTKGMKDGSVDALIFVAGLPAVGITELLTTAPGQFTFLQAADLLKGMNDQYNGIYQGVKIQKATYGTPTDIATVAIPTMLVCSPDLPEQLAYDLTRVLFDHQSELALAHPDGEHFTQSTAKLTSPVPLHPGARRFYEQG
ncbi:MAG: TAXI family TRAP transporter solute-binding subunit [Dactylosporangium sp.]|nr:TAXI family TRAP transporter solute-binding subunit [Dactylosporangium sp.]NNJ61326.1 TAXI family TRAP transporter solute-binding subunit [Dactylosporangium sp.]